MPNIEENTTKGINTEIKYNWQLFAESFLTITKCGCEKILNDNKIGMTTEGFEDRKLIISTVYNFKHSLEIILKTLIKNFYPEKLKTTHDIENVFKDIYPTIFNNIILKYKSKKKLLNNNNYEDLFEVTELTETSLKDKFVKLQELVDYYINISFIKKEIISIKDVKNTLFKYPEQKDKQVSLDYLHFMRKENFEEVKNIIKKVNKDCDELLGIMRLILIINIWFKKLENLSNNSENEK
ncbi:hypothetical protein K9M42_00575 [Patescibacteria group bacterium]|nr:hypothetical protein [Patescibacteria group bacterium]